MKISMSPFPDSTTVSLPTLTLWMPGRLRHSSGLKRGRAVSSQCVVRVVPSLSVRMFVFLLRHSSFSRKFAEIGRCFGRIRRVGDANVAV